MYMYYLQIHEPSPPVFHTYFYAVQFLRLTRELTVKNNAFLLAIYFSLVKRREIQLPKQAQSVLDQIKLFLVQMLLGLNYTSIFHTFSYECKKDTLENLLLYKLLQQRKKSKVIGRDSADVM